MAANPMRDSRAAQHILLGLGLAAGAVAAAALLARLAPGEEPPEVYTDYDDPHAPKPKAEAKVMSALWPPLFMALTVFGLRIWNAPASRARTQAMTLWGAAQALNATWMALGARRLGGKLAAAIASLGTAGAYALRARNVASRPAAPAASAPAGWMGVASTLGGELRRRAGTSHTVH